ncbi:NAD(P)/FAD-dependent oxidoreductase [Gordonia terrae]|uniref:NAD(P)/FAD-dependent oxidoreductase n=1 Tax=Gordonia terrae TaxID=2055 RepID=UPI003F6C8C24
MPTDSISIVGASAAGVAAARSLRAHGFDGRVVLIDADRRLPYERPPLSKTDSAETLTDILPADDYAKNDIDLLLGHRVDALDNTRRELVLDGGQRRIPADKVLLATGVRARRLTVPGADLANVLTLRDASDAHAVHSRLGLGGPLVVIGGGFIGLELAALARSRGIDVTVVELGPVPLARPLGLPLSRWLTDHHLRRGVRVITDVTVCEMRGTDSVEAVVLSDGTTLDAATVVVGVGVDPLSNLAEDAGVYCAAGIVVDDACRTSSDWIFAAGDVASRPGLHGLGRARIEHWDSAVRHGEIAAASMLGIKHSGDITPYFWSDQYDLILQMYGQRDAGHTYVSRAATDTSALAFWMVNGVVTAAAGVNASKDLRAAKTLIENRTPVRADELADPGVNLRALAKRASHSHTPAMEAPASCLG